MSVCVRLTSLDATAALARAVAGVLTPGSVVLLEGDLGAGKTTFTKTLAAELGVADEVTSPTFAIMVPHDARFPWGPATLLHLDAYRLNGPDALEELGVFELLDEGAVAVIEWGDVVAAACPEALRCVITVLDDDTRVAELSAPASQAESLGRIAAAVRSEGLPAC